MTDILIGVDSTGSQIMSVDNIWVSRFTAVHSATSGSFILWSNSAGNARVAVYNHSGIAPSTLNVGNDTSQVISAGRNVLTLSGGTIVEGVDYWLAAVSDTNILGQDTSESCRFKSQAYSSFTTWPSPLTGTTLQSDYTLRYAVYEIYHGGGLFSIGGVGF